MRGQVRIPLAPPQYAREATIALGIGAVFAWGMIATQAYVLFSQSQFANTREWSIIGLMVVLTAFWTQHVYRRARPPASGPAIDLGETSFVVPVSRDGRNAVELSYDEVTSLDVTGRHPMRRIFLGARGRLVVLPESRFVQPNALAVFVMEVRKRIRDLQAGEAQLALIARNKKFTEHALARTTPVTHVLLLLIGIGYLLQLEAGAFAGLFNLVDLGANSSVLVREGQYHRLFTANFLHGGSIHLFFNAVGLYSIGVTLERLIGSPRFLLVYLLSAVAGSAASAMLADIPMSVGASTAIFGTMGCLFVLAVRFRGQLPAGFSPSPMMWVAVFAVNAVLPLIFPIDVAAHIGGFVMGAGVTLLLTIGHDPTSMLLQRPSRILIGAAAVASGLFTAALIFGVRTTLAVPDGGGPDRQRVARAHLAQFRDDADALNEFAWITLMNDASKAPDWKLAREAAERASLVKPEAPEIADTLATALYMHGEFSKAIEVEVAAAAKARDLDINPDLKARFLNGFYSQIARFLRAEQQSDLHAPPDDDDGVKLALAPQPGENRELTIGLARDYPNGVTVHAIAVRGTLVVGHILVELGPSTAGSIVLGGKDQPSGEWVSGVRVEIGRVIEGAVQSGVERSWRATSYDHEVAGYPLYPSR